MGTSGLRKKVTVFKQENYIENLFNKYLALTNMKTTYGKSLILGGDGRFYNDVPIQLTIKMQLQMVLEK